MVVVDTSLFHMGYSLVTEVEKEAPNRTNILYKESFSQTFSKKSTIFSSYQLCGPLSVAAPVKYLVLLLIIANK